MELPNFAIALDSIGFFLACFLPLAVPLGALVAVAVHRIAPMVNILTSAIIAGYVVGVVVLLVVLRRLLPDITLNIYGAATVSVIVTAGVIFLLAYFVQRKLAADGAAMTETKREQQDFAVFGEDVRRRPKTTRRKR